MLPTNKSFIARLRNKQLRKEIAKQHQQNANKKRQPQNQNDVLCYNDLEPF